MTTSPDVGPSGMHQHLVLLPAVDVVSGQSVRLVQGRAGSEIVHGTPVDAIRSFVDEGATWIHLVDVDAAFGRPNNAVLLEEVVHQFRDVVNIELAGGITNEASLKRAVKSGCQRVILGTAALRDLEWTRKAIDEYGDRVALSLDVKGSRLSARGAGWEGGDLLDTLAWLDDVGCARYIITDVEKDGTMRGPNGSLLATVCGATARPVIASGGVSSLDDVRELLGMVENGIEGAIVGRALYDGAMSLAAALEAGNPEP